MKRTALIVLALAGCGSPAPAVVTLETPPPAVHAHVDVEPAPVRLAPRPTAAPSSSPRASRQRHHHHHRPPSTSSRRLEVTAYCWTGNRTASGAWPRVGMAAGNRWPFGTRLNVETVGVVTITDRIGHGSELDIYLGRDGCERRARAFGRRHLRVEVLR